MEIEAEEYIRTKIGTIDKMSFGECEDCIKHTKECFCFHELGMIKEMIRPPRCDLNVEKVKF